MADDVIASASESANTSESVNTTASTPATQLEPAIEKHPEGIPVRTMQWGPEHPGFNNDLDQFGTADYLLGYAQKIRMDLLRVARSYNARRIRVFRPKSTERCPYCTNQITGEKMLTNCPYCQSTGHLGGWDVLGDCYAYGDIGCKYHVATSEGTSEASGNNRDQFILVGMDTLLQDEDWFSFYGNKDCYLIYDAEPFMVTMQGTVVAQVVNAAGLTPISMEFRQIDW